jgi:methylase of polypeptide subunit release factors
LGLQVTEAFGRGDLQAVLDVTGDPFDPLNTLIRMFLCGTSEPYAEVVAALAPLPIAAAFKAGLVEPADGDEVRAGVWLHSYQDWWVVADLPEHLRPGRPPGDHVVGIGTGPVNLAAATVRAPVASALDIGTGCGVQALHLSEHVDRITATDLSPRALRFAETTAALNGLTWELRQGDLTAPVAGRRFDLIVANLPYVVSPGAHHATHRYRDSGRPGDAVCAELAATAAGLLTYGGYCQFLASWAHVKGEDWTERVAGWVDGTGCDAWIVQYAVTDAVSYVTQWLQETGDHSNPTRRAAWRSYFATSNIEAVGVGLITLRNTGRHNPILRVEERSQHLLGTDVPEWFARQDWLRDHDPLSGTFRAAPDVRLTQEATQDGGWQLDRQVLKLTSGLRSTVEIDPLIATLVGQCDGKTSLRDLVAALGTSHDLDIDRLAGELAPAIRHLVEHGILLPVARLRSVRSG